MAKAKNIAVCLSVLFFLLAGGVILAQEESIEIPETVQTAIEEAAEKALSEEAKPEEIKTDTEIKAEDLGVKEAKVLPGTFFYGFKNFFRSAQETVTRDPIKKAELQFRHANERIVEAKQLIEQKGEEKNELAEKVIERANRDFGKIAGQTENLKKMKERDGERVSKFLDKVADQSLKQQVVLQKLQEQVPEKSFVKIEEMRQRHLENFGQVMTKIEDKPEEIARRIPQIVENQRGSDFKELKAVEILRDLEDKVPEEAREALRMAQSALSQRFEQRFIALPEEGRQEKFQNYVKFMPGNAVRQFEAFDRMKESFQSEEMGKEMEIAKDNALSKFENQFSQFQGDEARQIFMNPWRDGAPEDLRTMTEMEMRMEPAQRQEQGDLAGEAQQPPQVFQDFQQFRKEAQNNFKESFAENPEALKQNYVFQKMEQSPDIVDLKMSQDMANFFKPPYPAPGEPGTEGIDAEGRPIKPIYDVFAGVRDRATQKFIENVEQGQGFVPEPGQFGQPQDKPPTPRYIFGSPIPAGLKVLEEIKNEIPFEARQGINRAIEAQTRTMGSHIERIDDPAMFERYKQQIEGDEAIKRQVENFGPSNFFRKIEEGEKRMEMIGQKEEARKMEKMEQINQRIFKAPEGENGQAQQGAMEMIKPEMRSEVESFRKIVPQNKQPIFRPQPFNPQDGASQPGEGNIGAPQRPNVPLTPERAKMFEGVQERVQPKPIFEQKPVEPAREPSLNFEQISPSPALQTEFKPAPEPSFVPAPAPAPVPAPEPAPLPVEAPTSQNFFQNFIGSILQPFKIPAR